MKKPPPHYIYPRWSHENRTAVLFCAIIGAVFGICGAGLLHCKLRTAGLVIWHIGLAAVLIYTAYYIKGLYLKYIDCAWDVYY
jgi:hypothetical protein